jgi:tetratricopeptide (TPR) repeat protein
LGIGTAALVLLVVVAWQRWSLRQSTGTPDAIWEGARLDFEAGRLDAVGRALERLGRLRHPTPSDRFLRAQLEMKRGQTDSALVDLGRIPDDDEVAAQARLLAGRIELDRGRLRFAEESLLAAVRLDPSLAEAHSKLIYIYGVHQRRREFHAEFVALSTVKHLSFQEVLDWCIVRNNSWEPGAIVGDLIRFVSADPLDRWSRLALADIFRRMGLPEGALSTLAALPLDDREANRIRAQIALDRGDDRRIEELLDRGPSDDPGLARLRGRQALARGDAPRAVAHFALAYASDPDDHETLFGFLRALELLGDEGQAKPLRQLARNFERLNVMITRAQEPDARHDAAASRAFGSVCTALHRDAEARAWFELVIAADPLDSDAQRALYLLKRGQRGPDERTQETR